MSTNSQTAHSRRLRAKTSNEWQAKQLAAGKLKRFTCQGKPEEVNEMRKRLLAMPGNSHVEKILTLLDFYDSRKK